MEKTMSQELPTIPGSVQRVLGKEATEDFARWFEIVLVERAVRRDEYREVLSRLDIIEHDIAELKDDFKILQRSMNERFEGLEARLDGRLDRINERFEGLETRLDERLDRMNERFDQMYRHITVMTRWTVGTLALLGTVITILLAIAQLK